MKKIQTSVVAVVSVFALTIATAAYAITTSSLYPISDGAYVQWTPKSGTTHYTQVDESTCNGTTDYVSTNTTSNRDSYGIDISNIPNGADISQVDITPCASRNKNGGGSATMDVFYRWNGTNSSDAGAYALTGTTPVGLTTTSFSSLSLAKRSLSTLQVGAVYTSGTKGARLSNIKTVITYTITTITTLNAPSGLSGSANSTGTSTWVSLSWTDNSSNETHFNVQRSSDNVNFTGIGASGENNPTFSDFGVSSGNTYYYRVNAANASSSSAYSNTATVVVP